MLSAHEFQYLMKLHYSQTDIYSVSQDSNVSVPYEITLLSNFVEVSTVSFQVSVPYEITLLSNDRKSINLYSYVSVPYGITLLSNFALKVNDEIMFQYLMELHYSQTTLKLLLYLMVFQYLMELHYSQTDGKEIKGKQSFSTL